MTEINVNYLHPNMHEEIHLFLLCQILSTQALDHLAFSTWSHTPPT